MYVLVHIIINYLHKKILILALGNLQAKTETGRESIKGSGLGIAKVFD